MRNFILLLVFFSFAGVLSSQKKWEKNYTRERVFVENKGQFSAEEERLKLKILYAADWGSTRIYFSDHGWVYSFLEVKKDKSESFESSKTVEEYKSHEREVNKFKYKQDEVFVDLIGGRGKYIPESECSFYTNYSISSGGRCTSVNKVKCFEKLRLKNVWRGIDLVFTVHPVSGLKYAFEIQKNTSIDIVQMHYSRPVKLENGAIHIPTVFGDIVDHEPYTFLTGNSEKIESSYKQIQEDLIGFEVAHSREAITIDPWVQTPTFASNWDCVWECETDASGNVYIIGGVMPMQLLKYNSAGILQWTYNTPYDTSNVWLGTFATDNAGNSYVTAGSVAAIQKINTSGVMVWNNPNPGGFLSSDEYWNISFNCDQSKLVVGGTTGFATSLLAGIFDIDVVSGNVLNTQTVASGNAFAFPPTIQEVRAISSSPSGKYYWLTQDTLGVIHQNFDLCGANSSLLFKNSSGYNLGYKCEDFRVNNTGIMAIRANSNFVYTQNGTQIQRRNLSTGAVINSANIPGGNATVAFGDYSVSNSGMAIDNCGNVYVGSTNAVVKFDANLNQLNVYPTSFKVYDVHIALNGEIVACGSTGNSNSASRSGSVQVINANACVQIPISCCDATICHPEDFCISDAPVTLTAATPGGVWSGTGITANGLFDPGSTGAGTYTITYTLACGSESVQINVSPCNGLDVCIDANGNWNVSGGVAPYNWQSQVVTQDCSACFPAFPPFVPPCSTPPGCAVNVTSWSTFSTNTTVPAQSAFPIQVSDATGQSYLISTAAQLSACDIIEPCPDVVVSVLSITPVTCFGDNNGVIVTETSGGVGPYTYSWQPGNFPNSATLSNVSAGVYTVISTDVNGCSDTLTVELISPIQVLISEGVIVPATCGSNNGSASISVQGGIGNYQINWSPTGGNELLANNLPAGNYTVSVTDENNCSSSLNIVVPNNSGFSISNLSVQSPSCAGLTNGSILVETTGGVQPILYSINGSPLSAIALFENLASGSYSIVATDANNCSVSASAELTEPLPFSIDINGDSIICLGDSVLLSVEFQNGTLPVSCTWANGQTGASTLYSPIASTSISASAIDSFGCTATASFNLTVLATNWNVQPNISEGFVPLNVNFQNFTDANLNYTWDFGNGQPVYTSQGNQSTNTLFNTPGTYQVEIFSDGPCPSSYSLTITAFQSMPLVVIVPTIFTVNNDGFNDFYTVYSENAISQKATIYNRWGGVVAELNSPNSSWNGKTNNQEASDGTYYIIYDIKGDNNQEMKGSGYFQKLSKF